MSYDRWIEGIREQGIGPDDMIDDPGWEFCDRCGEPTAEKDLVGRFDTSGEGQRIWILCATCAREEMPR